jgi:hypothetical protein
LYLFFADIGREEEVKTVHFLLDLWEKLRERLWVGGLSALNWLSLHGCSCRLSLLVLLKRLLAVLLEYSHAFHQILRELCEPHLGVLVFRTLRVSAVEYLPEIAHQLGVLSLLLLIEMR